MRRLHVDQTVSLSLDGERTPIACRVFNVQGSLSRLLCLGELTPKVVGHLATGCSGYLVFDEFRAPVGLRVAVRTSPPYLDAAVIDGIAMPERRRNERVKLEARARIVSAGDDRDDTTVSWTTTINLGDNGALVRHHAALDRDGPVILELMFGDDPEPIRADVRVTRRLDDAVGVAFDSIAADDATRLHEYLAGLRHRPRRRAARS